MKIYMLTNGNEHGLRILENSNNEIKNIIIEKKKLRSFLLKDENFYVNFIKILKRQIFYEIWQHKQIKKYKRYGNIIYCKDISSEKTIKKIKKYNIDYLVLGGIGIIKQDLISVIKKGVLNSHPGILPYARGVDVVENSILRNYPVGSTVHFVDSGIDTGDIILKEEIDISKYVDINTIKKVNDELAAKLMSLVLLKIKNDVEIRKFKNTKKYKYCNKITEKEKMDVEQKLRN